MKANYFNLLLLFSIGIAFVMGVVSVTNPMYSLNMSALPAYVNESTSTPIPTTAVTTVAPSPPPPVNATAPPAAAAAAASSSTSAEILEQLGLSHVDARRRLYEELDLPLITQHFSIACPMFGNCTRSGAGVAADNFVGTLEVVAEKMGCTSTSVNLARAFCLITLVVAVMGTALAAGAAQEVSCAERRWVRIVILVASSATFIFSIIAVAMITLLRTCLTGSVDHVERIVPFFTPRPGTSNVDSIAFPVFLTAMAFSASAAVMSILWILEKVGPAAVERNDDDEKKKEVGESHQEKLLGENSGDGVDTTHNDILGAGTEMATSLLNHEGATPPHPVVFSAIDNHHGDNPSRQQDDDPIDIDDILHLSGDRE